MQITGEHTSAFLDRFITFYDSVVLGVAIQATPGKLATVKVTIQAMDKSKPRIPGRGDARRSEWCQVELTVLGVHEYRFLESRQFPYRVLSDGMAVAASANEFVLDLDPGPDDWSPAQVHREGPYSKQYVVGERGDYEVRNIR
ncbi:hypothetical protein [Nocardia australiensis]|uniref:hypothetical protein n=1 Tax=Nocardia australiensis TaxID=2887191 RepID=UPI001D138018|nr:hypothetical protein [Nocardia australiensis]